MSCKRLLFLTLCMACSPFHASADVMARIGAAHAVIQNDRIRVEYNITTGAYRAISRSDGLVGFANASTRTNDMLSSDAGLHRSVKSISIHDALGDGKALVVQCRRNDGITQILEITLYAGKSFLSLSAGVINHTKRPVHLIDIRPMTGADIYPDARSWVNCKTLDGISGGGVNMVKNGRTRQSVNNLLLTFLDAKHRRTLVAGGLFYHDFVKYIHLGSTSFARKDDILQTLPPHERLSAYLDCGSAKERVFPRKTTIKALQGNPYTFLGADQDAEQAFGSVVFDSKRIVLEASGLRPGKNYRLGWSWWDYDGDGRVESVLAESPDGKRELTLASRRTLPAWKEKHQQPAQLSADIPAQMISGGKVRIMVTNDADAPNAVLSEAWLIEEDAASGAMDSRTKSRRQELPLDMIASDPVGRMVGPGETYIPKDRFYIDFLTRNPFQALEQYGMAVRMAQGAHPNLYSFPTICAWYVEVYDQGPKINNNAGLVEEMIRVKKSGFLRYSPVALRLVPDTYSPDNEQGWWDDAHWRQYGHYTKPYDTSASWGKAIKSRGGLPFTYVQTGFVSGDFVKAHPDYMLYKSSAGVEKRYQMSAWQYADDKNLPNYDYTCDAFQKRLLKSWNHLREGGVQGVMFDYPESAWHPRGGFENPHATCAYAYRSPFRICREGLGSKAWIHERIIGDGADVPLSDMTVGLVDSQRVWGDNNTFQPGMAAKCALRWYKYRTLYSYDMDAKSLFMAPCPNRQPLSARRRQAILTMLYVTAGRVLLANSFRDLTPEMLRDLSRLYPVQAGTHSARPVDAFTGVSCPRVYIDHLGLGDDMVTLFNPDFDHPVTLNVSISGDQVSGALGLDPHAEYYLYDFWNDRFAGKISGRGKIIQTLGAGEARVLSAHRVMLTPQVISTNRHITQGAVDMVKQPQWNSRALQLSGVSAVVGGEPYGMVIAENGYRMKSVWADGAKARIEHFNGQPGLIRVFLSCADNKNISWTVKFKNSFSR